MGRIGSKILEWTRRYLPCELAGWVGELGGAALAYGGAGPYAGAAAQSGGNNYINMPVQVERADDDLYTAAPQIYRSLKAAIQ